MLYICYKVKRECEIMKAQYGKRIGATAIVSTVEKPIESSVKGNSSFYVVGNKTEPIVFVNIPGAVVAIHKTDIKDFTRIV